MANTEAIYLLLIEPEFGVDLHRVVALGRSAFTGDDSEFGVILLETEDGNEAKAFYTALVVAQNARGNPQWTEPLESIEPGPVVEV